MSKKIFLIVNPKSGRAKIKNELLGIVSTLSEGGYRVEVYPTKARGDATDVIKKLPKSFNTVIVCGGDGTLNEVITGVMQSELDLKIGYIPSGTLNEWSSGLKISRNMQTAAKDILTSTAMPLDIGLFDNKYFSYTASFGAFTEASYSAPQDIKNMLGQVAYFLEGIKAVGNIRPIPLKFVSDDGEREGEYLFGCVTNSMSAGGVIKYDKEKAKVDLNDGLFEVVLIRKPENLNSLSNIIDGVLKHDFDREYIDFFHTSRLTVYNTNGLNWTLDGEQAVSGEVTEIKNLHSAVKFLIP